MADEANELDDSSRVVDGLDPMQTYEREQCTVFRKTTEIFGGLSNMASGFPLRVNGVDILTSEALYQCLRFPNLPDVQKTIIEQHSPMTAKMKSKPHRSNTRPDWDEHKVAFMEWCIRVKLAQNRRKFGDLLLSTADKTIVEESHRDTFWGTKVQKDGTLMGQNVLGHLLTKLRDQYASHPETMLIVEPLDVKDFLLLGQPIAQVK